jgi:hypothetical protein
VIADVQGAREDEAPVGRLPHGPWALVEARRGLPGCEREGRAGGEVEAELPALGAEPEAVLAAVVVERGARLAGFEEGVVDPAEAGSERRHGARHHAALESGRDGDATARIAHEYGDRAESLQKSDLVLERCVGHGWGRGAGLPDLGGPFRRSAARDETCEQ